MEPTLACDVLRALEALVADRILLLSGGDDLQRAPFDPMAAAPLA
jgi:hypothetical protein